MSRTDVSRWSVIVPEQGGRDERKVWVSDEPGAPRDRWWLWKPCKTTEGGERRLSDVAEVVAHRLARAMGLPAARYELAVRDGVLGAVSQNIAAVDASMVDGVVWGVREDDYDVQRIFEVLGDLPGPPGTDTTAVETFAGYLVLDAWIANTDRHARNWAVLVPATGPAHLAPTFDHGSALGAGLTETKRTTTAPQEFCERGRSRPFGRAKLVDLAAEAVATSGAVWWPERVATVDHQVWGAILETAGLSVAARTFIDEVLTINQERVSSQCRP